MLIIERGGQLSTVQDGGRYGYEHLGVTPGGSADDIAWRVGNWIVGNENNAASIEMTWLGARIRFNEDTLVAITGGSAEIRCAQQDVPMWRPVWLRAGALLCVERITLGARVYISVAGGIQVPELLGGFGTHLRYGFGGFQGRPLARGDMLSAYHASEHYPHLRACLKSPRVPFAAPRWSASVWEVWDNAQPAKVHVMAGPDVGVLGTAALQQLLDTHWTVQGHSDRQALRLQGKPVLHDIFREPVSAGVCHGVVQLPPDGNPIVLLADHQTTGGYPVLAVVASVDRCKLAQLKPGEILQFQLCTLAEAHQWLQQRKTHLSGLLGSLRWQWRHG